MTTSMQVKIISNECIKPSSLTPQHLRIHKLSLLDQLVPSTYVPTILFYLPSSIHPININITVPMRSQLLKQSLSETLTHFHPLAGRIKDSLSIDCNDEGARYIEAEVDSSLSQFLNHPDLSFLSQFLPGEVISWQEPEGTPGAHVAMMQVTNFACGGFVLGAFVSHMVVDGATLSAFLKAWAAATFRYIEPPNTPHHIYTKGNFDAPSLFPQNDEYPREATMMALFSHFLKVGNCVTRRIVFDAPALATLKKKAASSTVPNPTRVEVVTTLLWKHIMAAFKAKSNIVQNQRPTLMTHIVNLRRRAVPPFSEYTMGNFVFMATALSQCSSNTEDDDQNEDDLDYVDDNRDRELGRLARHVREAVSKLDGDFVQNLQRDGTRGLIKFCEPLKEVGETVSRAGADATDGQGLDYIGFNSRCNLGLYEADFGWGKPVWVASGGAKRGAEEAPYMNMVLLMDTRSGDGVEAWVCLDEQDMAILEGDPHFLAFVSLNPSPLSITIKIP
ncbi:stemmadenine O-acetyltransferase-like [Malus sylvestris]|uniref:stemmadenine O-acetyltransferase-like n=1 Tax=Malus sylvestris TaxID=3752 RepID=UPI0021AD1DCE|nr:stemmadenine O-acetyltransferase-like [Malus sylvestris]